MISLRIALLSVLHGLGAWPRYQARLATRIARDMQIRIDAEDRRGR